MEEETEFEDVKRGLFCHGSLSSPLPLRQGLHGGLADSHHGTDREGETDCMGLTYKKKLHWLEWLELW